MEVKELSPEACQGHKAHETWGAGLYEGDKEVGRVFLSRTFDSVYGHGWECTSSDPGGAAMLYLAAREKAREWSGGEIFIHFPPGEHQSFEFWMRRGFQPICIVFKGEM